MEGCEVSIPVLWLSYHDDAPKRGYWDQGLLDLLFGDRLYTPSAGYGWQNIEVDSIQPYYGAGAVVVLPARYHVDDVDRLNRELSLLQWVVLILTSDEESTFPREKLSHPNMAIYVQSPDPKDDDKQHALLIPQGFPKDAPELIRAAKDEAMKRPLDYWFSGQITHSRREQMADALSVVTGNRAINELHGDFIATPGFTQGLPHDEYYRKMASAKAIPAPSGAVTPDSFRLYEALEAGCVPIADSDSPIEGGVRNFMEYLYPGDPFPVIHDWHQLQDQLIYVRDHYPALNNRVFAWWQQYKRNLAYRVIEDVHRLSSVEPEAAPPDRQITVIIPTSPIPSHPSTAILEETIATVRGQLPHAEIIIGFDGVRPEQERRRPDYEEYTRRVLWLANHEWHNVLPIVFEEHQHQANVTREMLKHVKTPLVLFVEHDTPLTPDREFDWTGLSDAIASGDAHLIRFIHEELILPDYEHMMLDDGPKTLHEVPMVRTVQWSQRPHLASTAFYRQIVDHYFSEDSRTMIEDVMHGVVHNAYLTEGEPAWNLWRMWIYAPDSDSLGIKRSYHLDGRGDDPKYGMTN